MNPPSASTTTLPLAVVVEPLKVNASPSESLALTEPKTTPVTTSGVPTTGLPATGASLAGAITTLTTAVAAPP